MSFFDSKEEILKLELTSYGKFLLGRGRFKPVYYAFFDDDILYDAKYAAITESQNNTQTRILEETPFLKPQPSYSSAEDRIQNNKDLLYREIELLRQEESQIEADKNYALTLPIGQCAYNSDYAPSWSVVLLSGTIKSHAQYIDNLDGKDYLLSPYLKIPQINCQTSSMTINVLETPTQDDINRELTANRTIVYVDNTKYVTTNQAIEYIFDVSEQNTINTTDNFDIEVYVEKQKSISILDTTLTSSYWHQLDFRKQKVEVKNGILLDNPEVSTVDDDPSIVEYFFDLTVDDEIFDTPSLNIRRGTYISSIVDTDKPFGDDC